MYSKLLKVCAVHGALERHQRSILALTGAHKHGHMGAQVPMFVSLFLVYVFFTQFFIKMERQLAQLCFDAFNLLPLQQREEHFSREAFFACFPVFMWSCWMLLSRLL